MNTRGIIIQGAPPGITSVYAVASNGKSITIPVSPTSYSPPAQFSALGAPEGSLVQLFVVVNGQKIPVINPAALVAFNYSANGSAFLIKIVPFNANNAVSYAVQILSEGINTLVCSNSAAVVAEFRVLDTQNPGFKPTLYISNKLAVAQSVTIGAKQIGDMKVVLVRAIVTLGKNSEYQPILTSVNSPFVGQVVLRGTAFSTSLSYEGIRVTPKF